MTKHASPAQDEMLSIFLDAKDHHLRDDNGGLIKKLAVQTGRTYGATAQTTKALMDAGLLERNGFGRGHARKIVDLRLTWEGFLAAAKVASSKGVEVALPSVVLPGAPDNREEPGLKGPDSSVPVEYSDAGLDRLAAAITSGLPKGFRGALEDNPRRLNPGWSKTVVTRLKRNGGFLVKKGGVEAAVAGWVSAEANPEEVKRLLRQMASSGLIVRKVWDMTTFGVALPGYEEAMSAELDKITAVAPAAAAAEAARVRKVSKIPSFSKRKGRPPKGEEGDELTGIDEEEGDLGPDPFSDSDADDLAS